MPEKDPTFWQYLLAIPDPLKAMIAGAGVAFLRVMYDDREPRMIRRLLEAALCGVIACRMSGCGDFVASDSLTLTHPVTT